MWTHVDPAHGLRSADEGAARRRIIGLAAAAGMVGPVLFTLTFVVQALQKPDYSHVAEPVSALAADPHGWVQDVNFLVLGPLMIAYAVGLHRAVRPTPWGSLGPALLMVSGLGLVLAGLFPARDASGAFSVGPGHMTAAFTSFVPAGVGLIVLSRRLARDPSWCGLAAYCLWSGTAMTVLFLATGPLAVADTAPLHAWGGLLQRATVGIWFLCTFLLARRLLQVARAPHRAHGPSRAGGPVGATAGRSDQGRRQIPVR